MTRQHLSDLKRFLTELGRVDRCLVACRELPAQAATWADWPQWVPAQIRHGLGRSGIDRLWQHQVEALETISQGNHLILATGTGSGKSLAAWLPYFCQITAEAERPILQSKRPTALYLAPTKALAHDQNLALQRWNQGCELGAKIAAVDGDAGPELKNWGANQADIILSNPVFLHSAMLSNLKRWRHFLGRLRFILVDELHSYRGVAGANNALLLRRLLRLAHRLGAFPQLVFLSATTGDPLGHAESVLGTRKNLRAISEDTSGRGKHSVYLWQPKIRREEENASLLPTDPTSEPPRVSVLTEAAELSAELLGRDLTLLTFARSRVGVETISTLVRDQLSRRWPTRLNSFAAYRGGYLPEERRALENALRSGQIRGLATTSALELGIDICGLDATITCGWPGTRASFWQQSGRAGRSGAEGLSIFIASDNPLDSYLLHHPEQIFSSAEQVVFNTQNIYVLVPHLLCAAAEAPLGEDDLSLFGLTDFSLFQSLADQGLLVRRPTGWYWNITRPENPWEAVSLRGTQGQVQIVEGQRGTVIGSVDQSRADATLFPGAIYLHQGSTWQVVESDHLTAIVKPGPRNLRTRANTDHSVKITKIEAETNLKVTFGCAGEQADIPLFFGQVEVASQVLSYDLLRLPGLQFQGRFPLKSPGRTLVTNAVWYTLPPRLVKDLELADPTLLGSALHAAEHASIGLLPLLAVCDRWDLGGLSIVEHPETGLPTVFVYDGTPGGAGFVEHGFYHFKEWMFATYQQVASCTCSAGCPRCIHSPKCGNANQSLSKSGALKLLKLFCLPEH